MTTKKVWVIEIHGRDDIRTFNSLGAECDGWKWTGSALIHQPGEYTPREASPALRQALDDAISMGEFPVHVPYHGEDLTRIPADIDEGDLVETTTHQEALAAARARHQRRAEEIATDLARNAASLRGDVAAGVDVEARLGLIDRAATDLRSRLAAIAALTAFENTITEEG